MKPVYVKPSIYIDFNKAIDDKDPSVISDPKGEEIVGTFYEKNCKKIKESLELKK